jgi:hypothetical protein
LRGVPTSDFQGEPEVRLQILYPQKSVWFPTPRESAVSLTPRLSTVLHCYWTPTGGAPANDNIYPVDLFKKVAPFPTIYLKHKPLRAIHCMRTTPLVAEMKQNTISAGELCALQGAD